MKVDALETKLPGVKDLLRSTEPRRAGRRSSFFHDVKALFLTHAFDRLKKDDVIGFEPVRLYYDKRGTTHKGLRSALFVYIYIYIYIYIFIYIYIYIPQRTHNEHNGQVCFTHTHIYIYIYIFILYRLYPRS